MSRKNRPLRAGKVVMILLGVILAVVIAVILVVTFLISNLMSKAQHPEITPDPIAGEWYRITPAGAVDSTGGQWHGLFRLGKENKVAVYFYGGGVSINETTAAVGSDFYTTDAGADGFELTGFSSTDEKNPFHDWTIIVIPYSTGDWHVGTNKFPYTDAEGNEKILHHNGYHNFRLMMDEAMKYVDEPEAVFVTGWSGGGFGAAFLADDVFRDYFPQTTNKTVLVDSALLIYDQWHEIAVNVWKAPAKIADDFTTDNLVLDSLKALSIRQPKAKILFACSSRDSALTQYQNYLSNGVFEATEEMGETFHEYLADMTEGILSLPNSAVFIWTDKNSDSRELTMHTITWFQFYETEYDGVTAAEWAMDAVNGNLKSYGLELLQ